MTESDSATVAIASIHAILREWNDGERVFLCRWCTCVPSVLYRENRPGADMLEYNMIALFGALFLSLLSRFVCLAKSMSF